MKPQALINYANERESLTLEEVNIILDRGKELALKTGLIQVLEKGGTALFPHPSINHCGDQVAAVVYASIMACKKTGKNQILVLGVLHTISPELLEAKKENLAELIFHRIPTEEFLARIFPTKKFLV